ncbi:MAG: hypothetical protein HYU03_07065 [Thaumarchaeota archaeon]|nr:hypothetical protein [Nitrososphaerota archaeon]
MNWEESKLTSGRRSRLEMTCDILRVISQGVEKPTRIMQLANLTWKDLLMYLEALLRTQLVARDTQGNRAMYRLTEKGSTILSLYLKLKQESAVLGLETLTTEHVSSAMRATATGLDSSLTNSLVDRLQTSGFKIEDNRVVGKSGETHNFNIVATASDGSRHGYLVIDEIDEQHILGLFVSQLDTDLHIHAYSKKEVTPEAEKLAQSYSISVAPWEEAKTQRPRSQSQANTLAFAEKHVLLEVDPSSSYERIVRDFAIQYKSSGYKVFVFTWRGSPVYETLSKNPGIAFFTMSTTVSYAKEGSNPNETLVPQNDQAVILDELGKVFKSNTEDKLLILFDSLSDLIVTFGFERSYEFVKNVNEMANERALTSVFIIKSRAHDEKIMSLVRGLYRAHLSYGGSGLSVTRET